MFRLADHEVSILLGAVLMHWGVPFRFAAKRSWTDSQRAIIDQANDKLLACRTVADASLGANLTTDELALLADILNNCLEECGTDDVELRLHLQANHRDDVVALLERMQSFLNPTLQTTHP